MRDKLISSLISFTECVKKEIQTENKNYKFKIYY